MSSEQPDNHEEIEEQIRLDYSNHRRLSELNRLVYPVVSRRSRGLSLGVNLNPDKKCTFNCVYCQVDRNVKITNLAVDLNRIRQELEHWASLISENDNHFKGYPLKDISIAGDGEPTIEPALPQVIEILIDIRKKYDFEESKLILFTNGCRLDRGDLTEVFPAFFQNNGEIWLKLDYWDQESLEQINRTKIKFEHLMANIKKAGAQYPLVIQSCFFRWKDEPYSNFKYAAYSNLMLRLIKSGIQIDRIQAYTLARTPTESGAAPWTNKEMDKLTEYLQSRAPVKIEKFYSN